MSSPAELKEKVLDVIPSNVHNAESATKISKSVGYAKFNKRVGEVLEELVNEGFVSKDESGTYVTYFKGEKEYQRLPTPRQDGTVEIVSKEDEKEQTSNYIPLNSIENEKESRANVRRVGDYNLPTNSHGYKVNIILDENDEPIGLSVIPPDQEQEIRLKLHQTLFIINLNKDYRFILDTASDAFKAIAIYSKEKNIGTFQVTDSTTNSKISLSSDPETKRKVETILQDPLVFWTVTKHNKAGECK